jgi:hypothetical protein
VEILLGKMSRPEVGMFFVDANGVRHRIKYVSQTDISWFCYCFQSSSGNPQPSPLQVAVDDGDVIPLIQNSQVVGWQIKDSSTGQLVTLKVVNGVVVVQ